MQQDITKQKSLTTIWAGRVLSGLVVIALMADAAVGIFAPHMLRADMELTGFPMNLSVSIATIILLCSALYAIPRTAVLGAIMITGFLGGAICTHFRIGEMGSPPQIICLLLGLMTWGGLYLRDPRVRELIPLAA